MIRMRSAAVSFLIILCTAQGQELLPERSPIEMITMLSHGTLFQDFRQVVERIDPAADIQLLSYGHDKILALSLREVKTQENVELLIALLDINKKPATVLTRRLQVSNSTFEILKKLWSEELRKTAYHDERPSNATIRDALFYHLAIQFEGQSYAGYFSTPIHPTAFTTRIISIADTATELAESPHLTPEVENKLIGHLED